MTYIHATERTINNPENDQLDTNTMDSLDNRSMYTSKTRPALSIAWTLALVLVLGLSANSRAGSADPGIPDTVHVQSVEGFRGGKAVVPVTIYNDEFLGAVELTLKFDPANLTLDSVSFLGGLVESFSAKFVTIDTVAGVVDAAAIGLDSSSSIPPGGGFLARLFFSISMTAPVGDLVIDTTSIRLPGGAIRETVFSTLQTDTSVNETIFPRYIPGKITVPDREATNDSIWVADATTVAGNSFSLDVSIVNQANLVTLEIPLTYSTHALIFDSVSFAGTRGILAGKSRLAQRQDLARQLLITLEYFDTSPLTPGRGALARLYFTAADTAAAQIATIDTAAFLGIQSLEVTTTVAEGSVSLIPVFLPGSVQIDISTNVEDGNSVTLPEEFTLSQNYPNPFNPTTTIAFALPKTTVIQLEVYNILGQQVRTLIDGRMPAGTHTIEFDGRNDSGAQLSSGIYFYRLTSSEVVQTHKMTLLK